MLTRPIPAAAEPVTRPLLVGESNPYGGDPYYALYPAPDGCSGHRLCCLILGMSRSAYLALFDRVNLCEGKWTIRKARAAADDLTATPNRRIVLCGSKVASAFGFGFFPFGVESFRGSAFLILPHPSGLCRLWNEFGVIDMARKAVAAFLPDVAPFLGVAPYCGVADRSNK